MRWFYSFGFLAIPLAPQTSNVESALLGFGNDGSSLSNDRSINHLAIQSPGSSPLRCGLLVRDDHPHRPVYLIRARGKQPLHSFQLVGVYALLAVEPHRLAARAFLRKSPDALLAAVRRTHQVDGAGQGSGPGGSDDCGTRIQKLRQRRRPRNGQVEGEVLGRKYQAAQVGGGAADAGEVHDGAGRLDQGDNLDGIARVDGVPLRGDMAQDVGDKRQVGGRLNFGHDNGIDERRGREGRQVVEGKGGGDGVDADCELGDEPRAGFQ